MTSDRLGQTELLEHERPQITEHAIVPGQQLVELAARAEILVVEDRRAARLGLSVEPLPERFFERRHQRLALGKEARKRRETIAQVARARRAQLYGSARTASQVDTLSPQPRSADRRDLVGELLLRWRQLGHDGDARIAQTRRTRRIPGGNRRQDPGGTLVMH